MGERLGQHFLKNLKAPPAIIHGLDLKPGDTVIEIGPGTGALTTPLLVRCAELKCQYIGIERDSELAAALTAEHANNPQVKIVSGDALTELPTITAPLSRYKLIGNIPYYITGSLLRQLGESSHKPARSVLMIQKEVAERIAAKPGEMSLLAAATQIWAAPHIIMHLPPSDFSPPPNVHSSVISLVTHTNQLPTSELEQYFKALHIIFKQPRKMLLNNLSSQPSPMSKAQATELLSSRNIQLTARPQDLSVEDCVYLSRALAHL